MFRSQSTVSLQLKKLEEMVGTSLFHRTVNGLVLTRSGKMFLREAREFLQVHDRIVSNILGISQQDAIRVGMPDSLAPFRLSDILARFHREHPQIAVNVHVQSSRALKEGLRDGHFDVVVVQVDPRFESDEILVDDELAWVVAQDGEKMAESRPLPIVCTAPTSIQGRFVTETLEHAAVPYSIACSGETQDVVIAAVLGGMGVGAITRGCLVPGLQVVGGNRLPLLPMCHMALIKSDRSGAEAVSAFANAVYAHFGLRERFPLAHGGGRAEGGGSGRAGGKRSCLEVSAR